METQDSTAFIYSGMRGSRFNYSSMSPRYSEVFEHAYAPIPVVPPMAPMPRSFFNENPADMLADSIKFFSGGFYAFPCSQLFPFGNKISQATLHADDQL